MKWILAQCFGLAVVGAVLLQPTSCAQMMVALDSLTGADIYQAQCSVSHGANLKGVAPMVPFLIHFKQRSDADIKIGDGKGRGMAFPDLSDDDLNALAMYLEIPDRTPRPAVSIRPMRRPLLQMQPAPAISQDQTSRMRSHRLSQRRLRNFLASNQTNDAAGG
jgi:mono/diheme cytochrome c family protein